MSRCGRRSKLKIISVKRANKIEQDAADWLARRDAQPWSDADRVAFDEWLAASPIHKVEFLRMEYAWEESLRLKALGAGIDSNEAPRPGRWVFSGLLGKAFSSRSGRGPAALVPGRVRLTLALAASVVVAVAAVALIAGSFYGGRYSTTVGQLSHIAMADGSHVTLNTDTVLRVAVTTTERKVDLQRGEAFFKVAKDPSRPFIVTIGEQRVIAVGTQFSVRREGTDAQVVVIEGIVRIETGGKSPLTTAAALPAGSVAHASHAGTSIQSKPLAQAEELLSWRTGVLELHDTTLAEAAAEFNRYNAHKIVIRDPNIGAMHISGSFQATNAEAFARLLERGYPLRADTVDADIILSGR
jgi:transmembrane sensor